MLGESELVAFVSTTDPLRARGFFEDVLGLCLVEESPYALVFDANGTTLRVTVVEQLTPAEFTVLGWRVGDVASCIRALRAAGVETVRYAGMQQDGDGVWTSPGGGRVAWFRDPDGNLLSLTEEGQAGSV